MNHLILPGPTALSPFRVAALVSDFADSGVHIESIKTGFFHYISLVEKLSGPQSELLTKLLTYDNALANSEDLVDATINNSTAGDSVIIRILPRPGTISPWSSKATNIANVCGLTQVERIERGLSILIKFASSPSKDINYGETLSSIYDRMTQSLYINTGFNYNDLFSHHSPKPLVHIDILSNPDNLKLANKELGLALDEGEIAYLTNSFVNIIGRNPTDVELFMFAQVNSEHCRHKIFNADWSIDNLAKDKTLFGMIRNTHKLNPEYTISAYSDNAAVIEGADGYHYTPDFKTKKWSSTSEKVHTLIKVETHNHPTAVSPFAGAATGSGGEIRDEGAVGRGSKSKCGLSGFSVSDLLIPDLKQDWEMDNIGKPGHIASSLDIMLEGPIGSAAFNNEFGRPCINGYFRTLSTTVTSAQGKEEIRGFHKPIMLAGGMGAIRPSLALKNFRITPGAKIIVLGGQSMLIGLGGGAASSISSGEGSASLDFASVQRGNPEMQRRAQFVIDACVSLPKNPIQSIHDVGAGGLSNALPELVHDNDLGAVFQLRDILSLEPGMSPMEIWCNESQERYVLGVAPEDLQLFTDICNRERAPFAVVGEATTDLKLILKDSLLGTTPIDLDMSVLFGKPPKMSRTATTADLLLKPLSFNTAFQEALHKVLQLPSVGSKSFLITIGDRTVTGLIDRDQMVGPWQIPVSNVGVTATSLGSTLVSTGEALAMGEKPTIALIDAAASAKMCVAESLLNLFSADIKSLDRVKLSANWMSAASHAGEGVKLYQAVQAIGLDLCPDLGISIPVGKDSMSMKMKWDDKEVIAPMSLVSTAFGRVDDTSKTWTPQLQNLPGTVLVLVDLSKSSDDKKLGGSALAQVFKQIGNTCPTVYDNLILKKFLEILIKLHKQFNVLAYHDRSDGGLITTILEMCFAGRCGVETDIKGEDSLVEYFNEELGAVFQIYEDDFTKFTELFKGHGIGSEFISVVGKPDFKSSTQDICIKLNSKVILESTRSELQQLWTKTSYHMQKLRDNPVSAAEEFEHIKDNSNPGLSYQLSFNPADDLGVSKLVSRPKVAILREQGVNGQQEMAWCFEQAGFESIDVHMTDIIEGRVSLSDFVGIAACGGFSYGDVLGAASGWAKSVLYNTKVREEFRVFFQDRQDTFAFGACNGCQFLSKIQELIPGCENWPIFTKNISEQYEARVCMVEIVENNSIFLKGMKGSKLPIAVAHGEGHATFESVEEQEHFIEQGLTSIQFVDNYGSQTESYPYNPNGSPHGITGISSPNGRVLAMMPHPERVVRKDANSWYPEEESKQWGDYAPWIRLFRSARDWVADV